MNSKMKKCIFCNKSEYKKLFEYFSPPLGETKFQINSRYSRYFNKCNNCKHFYSVINFNFKNLYNSEYNKATYKGKLKKNFLKITKLPNIKSDNFFRVKRIKEFTKKYFKEKNKKTLLDIGSGLGIFPYKATKYGFICTALDPDPAACKHIEKNLKIKTLCKDFLKKKINLKFDIITINKVIEHVKNPYFMLKKTRQNLKKNGIIYIEVPDAIEASKKGKNREEFFIDHLHVFSKKSLSLLLKKTNYKKIDINQIVEPSGKFTIYAFARK